jgi:hypothetical protein
MISNPERCVLGIATCFGTRSANGNYWTRSQWQEWLDLELGLDLLYDHGPLFNLRGGLATIGTARRFAPIDHPVDGLLALAEIADDGEGYGDGVLAELRSSLSIWGWRTVWGFSVGVHIVRDENLVVPYEVSVTARPAFSDARILEVGQAAVETFGLLSEQHVAAR